MLKNIGKISNSRIKLLLTAFGFAGISFVGFKNYTDVNRDDAKSRVYQISQTMVNKQYHSVRDKDVELIRKLLNLKSYDIHNTFSVLTGPRGIGKTVAIQTAAENLKGVITISVQPGLRKDKILDMVGHKITGRKGSYIENEEFMKEVIELYRSRTGKDPVIIIQANERFENQDPAQLSAAARVLVDEFGLNVLIDCGENAFPETLRTHREIMIELEPMSWDMMRQLPEFKDLFKLLKSQGNEEVVLAICNGLPLLLSQLNNSIESSMNDEEKNMAVKYFVMNQVILALNNINDLIRKCPKIIDVLNIYKGKENFQVESGVLYKELKNVQVPNLNRVLRKAWHRNKLEQMLVPANGATAVLLRMGSIDSKPRFDDIKQAISMWYKPKENEA